MDALKILIAYDGTANSDAAVASLVRAGLPDEAEVVVLTVSGIGLSADVEDPPDGDDEVIIAEGRALRALRDARTTAGQAAGRLGEWFPTWRVRVEAHAEPPAAAVLATIAEWKPNLVVVGTHGRSLVGRVFLGSVSMKILSDAPCSVRIGRRTRNADGPVRLIIGVDGSQDALAAVDAMAARTWPDNSEAHIVAAYTPLDLHYAPMLSSPPDDRLGDAESAFKYVREQIEEAAAKLAASGLTIVRSVRVGVPVPVLLDEAETWSADAIVLGARGHSAMERLLLGSVSTSVAMRANCPVEVIRPHELA